jgi:hypothetical protein
LNQATPVNDTVLYSVDAATLIEVNKRTVEWLERAVIGLNLCPFARAPIRQGLVRYAITGAMHADQLLMELERQALSLASVDASELETILLIHPLAMGEFLDFHFFLQEGDALIRRLGLRGVLQIANFHPLYQFASSERNDVSNYTNRSPYPILHLLREDSVTRASATLSDASIVTERNIKTLQQLGQHGWDKLWTQED